MPRILLSTAHIAPMILDALGADYEAPPLVAPYPSLPKPFQVTAERVNALQKVDTEAKYEEFARGCRESAAKSFCQART